MGNLSSAPDCVKEPSHKKLLLVVDQLTNIDIRLNELKQSLGVTHPEGKSTEECPTEVNPDTLVETMARLPKMISVKVDQIHRSIDELKASLL